LTVSTAGVADPVTGAPIARHEVGSTHAYFVRNRHYSPELGRFLQRDPNATSQAVLGAMAYAGVGLDPTVDEADLADHLRDGVGVYWYVRASPLLHSDPLGLFSYGEVLGAAGVQGLLAGTITNALGGTCGLALLAVPLVERLEHGQTQRLQRQQAAFWPHSPRMPSLAVSMVPFLDL
jgi:uncharacterized protein RhaS with RHS repeats